ncbi:MAG: dipeptidase [Chlamydiales bacterium]
MILELEEAYRLHEKEILEDFLTFLRFQSVSTDSHYREEVLNCSHWVCGFLEKIGFHVEVWETTGYPVIFASCETAGPNQPTLLTYNHYDVQPADPFELWENPPFEPIIKEGEVYARGTADNKGQCLYTLYAMKILMEKYQENPPINIKMVIEGEEECGSHGLAGILKEKKDRLKADYIAVVDNGIMGLDQPSITLGVRGIVTMDILATGAAYDLHSGMAGGMVYNPIHALTEILAQLRDKDTGKILVPHFYDTITPLSEEENQKLSLKGDMNQIASFYKTQPTGGEKGFTPQERTTIRPTLEINGISGGYTGDGFKTVIPAQAKAKVSCRLVPGQDPHTIGNLVADTIRSLAPKGIDVEVHIHEGVGAAIRSDINSPIVKAFQKAYEEVFQLPVSFLLTGGTIPIAVELQKTCEGEIVFVGVALPSDQFHSPNEHFGIERLKLGCLCVIRAIENLVKG